MPNKKPWFKFYPRAWTSDPHLQMCSTAARGLWIEMIAIMHEGDHPGFLMLGGVPLDARQVSAITRTPDAEGLMAELHCAGVYSKVGDVVPDDIAALIPEDMPEGTIFSRRIVREEAFSFLQMQFGKMGGNPNLKATHIPRVLEDKRVEEEKERESTPRKRSAPRTTISPDWQPNDADTAFSQKHGLVAAGMRDRFVAHHEAKGSTMASWSAAWRTWCLNEVKFRQPAPTTNGPAPYVRPKFN